MVSLLFYIVYGAQVIMVAVRGAYALGLQFLYAYHFAAFLFLFFSPASWVSSPLARQWQQLKMLMSCVGASIARPL